MNLIQGISNNLTKAAIRYFKTYLISEPEKQILSLSHVWFNYLLYKCETQNFYIAQQL